MPDIVVAALHPACRICVLEDTVRELVHRAIWSESTRTRLPAYRKNAVKVIADAAALNVDPKHITKHADHVERSWRMPTERAPAKSIEVPVFAPSIESVADRAGMLGHAAMAQIEQRMADGMMEDRDVIAVAKLGVGAVATREKIIARRREADINVAAIFGIVSGHLVTPPHEIKNVTPIEELEAEIDAERASYADAG